MDGTDDSAPGDEPLVPLGALLDEPTTDVIFPEPRTDVFPDNATAEVSRQVEAEAASPEPTKLPWVALALIALLAVVAAALWGVR